MLPKLFQHNDLEMGVLSNCINISFKKQEWRLVTQGIFSAFHACNNCVYESTLLKNGKKFPRFLNDFIDFCSFDGSLPYFSLILPFSEKFVLLYL